MRVISQIGMKVLIDLPYENIAISQSLGEPNSIIAFDVSNTDDSFFRMARYSTPEKSEKAMHMLHSYYGDYMIKKVYKQEISGMWPVFQFPAEDEL